MLFFSAKALSKMPLIQSSVNALPFIDPAPSSEAFTSANALIQAELESEDSSTLHPSITAAREPRFSELVQGEHERILAGQPKQGGIDLSRYEASALEAPSNTSPHSDEKSPELLAKWRETLQRAYGLNTYLNGRVTNLSLLETYGKTAWLIGNSQLEDDMKERYSDEEIIDEFVTFFVAGMDTTGHLIGMTLYNLTQNPQYLTGLEEERNAMYNTDKMSADSINKMDVLHLHLKETLRMQPPAPFTFIRVATVDHKILDLQVKKGHFVI